MPIHKHSQMSNQEVADSRVVRKSLTSLSPFPFKACSERITDIHLLALTKSSDKKFWPPFYFATVMLDRVLRGTGKTGQQTSKLPKIEFSDASRLACVASVSNRVIARKLERKQKKLPLPRHSFFLLLSQLSKRTSRGNACYAGYFKTKIGSCPVRAVMKTWVSNDL